jgi:glutathione S-transferase
MPSAVRLFWAPWSHYAICAELQLAIKKAPSTLVRVPYHDKTELLRETGQDYVPELDWDGTMVAWEAIPEFLEGRVPAPTLYPGNQRGVATLLERWGHQALEEKVWKGVVTKMAGTFTDPREAWVFEYLQTRVRGSWTDLEERREQYLREAEGEFAAIDMALDGRDWLLGAPSLADCGVYSGLAPLRAVGENVPAKFARLRGWIARVEALRADGPARGASPHPAGRGPAPSPKRTLK